MKPKVDFFCRHNFHSIGEPEPEISEILQKLSPGNVLSEIGFSPSLLSKRTLKRVQEVCLGAKGINPESLDSSEQYKLNHGLACSVRHVLKQRGAKAALFEKDLTGLRNDLALRRELRKPVAKVRTCWTFNYLIMLDSAVCIDEK